MNARENLLEAAIEVLDQALTTGDFTRPSTPTTDRPLAAGDARLRGLAVLHGRPGTGKSLTGQMLRTWACQTGAVVPRVTGEDLDSFVLNAALAKIGTNSGGALVDSWRRLWLQAVRTAALSCILLEPAYEAWRQADPQKRDTVLDCLRPLDLVCSIGPVSALKRIVELKSAAYAAIQKKIDSENLSLIIEDAINISQARVVLYIDFSDDFVDNSPEDFRPFIDGLLRAVHSVPANRDPALQPQCILITQTSYLGRTGRLPASEIEIAWDSTTLLQLAADLFQTEVKDLPRTVDRLIAIDSVENMVRQSFNEPVVDYLLRHGFGTPRDLLTALRRLMVESHRYLFKGADDERSFEQVIRLFTRRDSCIRTDSMLRLLGTSMICAGDTRMPTTGYRRSIDLRFSRLIDELGGEVFDLHDLKDLAWVCFDDNATLFLDELFGLRIVGAAKDIDERTFRSEFGTGTVDQQQQSTLVFNSCILDRFPALVADRRTPRVAFQ